MLMFSSSPYWSAYFWVLVILVFDPSSHQLLYKHQRSGLFCLDHVLFQYEAFIKCRMTNTMGFRVNSWWFGGNHILGNLHIQIVHSITMEQTLSTQHAFCGKKTTTRATSSLRPLTANPTLSHIDITFPFVDETIHLCWWKLFRICCARPHWEGRLYGLLFFAASLTLQKHTHRYEQVHHAEIISREDPCAFSIFLCLIVVYVAGCRPGIWSILTVLINQRIDLTTMMITNPTVLGCIRKPWVVMFNIMMIVSKSRMRSIEYTCPCAY